MSGQIICIGLQTGRHTDRKSVHTSRRSSVGSQESNMFDSCDRYDDRFENSEFDCSHMTIGLQTGRRTVFANRSSYRSSCVNALLYAWSGITAAMWMKLWHLWRIYRRTYRRSYPVIGETYEKNGLRISLFVLLLLSMIQSDCGNGPRSHYLLMPRVQLTKCCQRGRRD